MQAHRAVRQAGGVIKLVHLGRRIALPLAFGTKLMVVFESFEDEAEALGSFRTDRMMSLSKDPLCP